MSTSRAARPTTTARVVARARWLDDRGGIVRAVSSALTLGLTTHMGLRRFAIDHAVLDAVDEGVRQLVILGAGLDDRAARLRREGLRAFAVDRPGAAHGSGAVRVDVDFEHDDVAESLARAGHDPGQPTVFTWEGVTMYLTRGATDETLGAIARASAPNSTVVMTYATPALSSAKAIHPFVRPLFQAIGEPLVGLAEPAEIARRVETAGFAIVRDDGSRAWAVRAGRPVPRHVLAERILVARRR